MSSYVHSPASYFTKSLAALYLLTLIFTSFVTVFPLYVPVAVNVYFPFFVIAYGNVSEFVPSFNLIVHSVPNFSNIAVKLMYNVVFPFICELSSTEFAEFVSVKLVPIYGSPTIISGSINIVSSLSFPLVDITLYVYSVPTSIV